MLIAGLEISHMDEYSASIALFLIQSGCREDNKIKVREKCHSKCAGFIPASTLKPSAHPYPVLHIQGRGIL